MPLGGQLWCFITCAMAVAVQPVTQRPPLPFSGHRLLNGVLCPHFVFSSGAMLVREAVVYVAEGVRLLSVA